MPANERPEVPDYGENLAASGQPDAHHLIQVLLDRLWIVALCVVLTSLGAAIYVRRAPRIYQASATVQVENQEQRALNIPQMMQEDLKSEQVLNTIVQKLRSRPLLANVLETNRLDRNPSFLGPVEGPQPDKEALVTKLEGMVKTTLRRQTRLVDVVVSSGDPKLAAVIANSIVDQFSSLDEQLRTSVTEDASVKLQEEADRQKKKLELSEQQLQKYREQVGSVSIQQSQDSVTPKLQIYNNNLTQARAEMDRLNFPRNDVYRNGCVRW